MMNRMKRVARQLRTAKRALLATFCAAKINRSVDSKIIPLIVSLLSPRLQYSPCKIHLVSGRRDRNDQVNQE
jgi:hypothetical protein